MILIGWQLWACLFDLRRLSWSSLGPPVPTIGDLQHHWVSLGVMSIFFDSTNEELILLPKHCFYYRELPSLDEIPTPNSQSPHYPLISQQHPRMLLLAHCPADSTEGFASNNL